MWSFCCFAQWLPRSQTPSTACSVKVQPTESRIASAHDRNRPTSTACSFKIVSISKLCATKFYGQKEERPSLILHFVSLQRTSMFADETQMEGSERELPPAASLVTSLVTQRALLCSFNTESYIVQRVVVAVAVAAAFVVVVVIVFVCCFQLPHRGTMHQNKFYFFRY